MKFPLQNFMKKSYIITIQWFLFCLTFLASCKTEELAELNKGNTPLLLSASSTNLVLSGKDQDKEVLSLNWTTGSNLNTNAAIVYRLEFAKQGSNFSNPFGIDLGKGIYSQKYSNLSLNNLLLNNLKAKVDEVLNVEARVIAQTQADGINPEISPTSILKVKPYQTVSSTLYLIGDATPNGWDNTKATSMNSISTESGGFTWTGNLSTGNFKFITSLGQWIPSYNKSGNTLILRTDFSQPDEQFSITKTGVYTINVNLYDLSIKITQATQPPYRRLWMVGDATPNGWNIDKPNEMTVDSSNLFRFNYNEVLKVGEFKIPTATGNWGGDFYMPLSNHPDLSSTSVQLVKGGTPDNKWQISTAGAYKISLDLLANTISIKPFTAYKQLWLVGDATPAGWSIDNPTPMIADAQNPYIFTWTGNLNLGEFKIPTATGNWGGDFFMPLVNHQSLGSKSAKFVAGGNPDNKWQITQAGNYKITINQLKETVEIQKL